MTTKNTRSMTKPRKKAKAKSKPKLESKARIRRRLFRLWSEKVQTLHGHACAISKTKRGDVIDGAPAILDAHHLEDRRMCPALRFDALNGILLTKRHHKFGKNSAHRGGLWFFRWLSEHRPLQLAYVLEHRDDVVNLEDREVLAEIERKLKAPITREELKVLGYDGDAAEFILLEQLDRE